jgi:DNA-binding transcriptional MocR family regulator
MDGSQRSSLASFDQLERVVYIGSYSKTISPNLRTGFLLARRDLLDALTQLKMISGLTSSEITERITFGVVTDGRWRKHLRSVRERLAEAHRQAGRSLDSRGFELFHEPEAGMYLWARHPDLPDSAVLSQQATGEGIMLGPGQLFLVEPRPTGWLRFNVAFSQDERLWRFLDRCIERGGQDAQ